MRGFLLLVGLLLCVSPLKAIEPNHGNLSGLAESYGYVLGQNLLLERIARKYPDLAREALLAKIAFERTFGDIHARLDPKLSEFMGEENFRKFRVEIEVQLTEMSLQQEIIRADAESFLQEVSERAKGEILSPTLENLLAIRFGDNPAQEFVKGFRLHYSTDGMGKSRGVVLNMQLPKSWQQKEGYRPHIVQKWQSEVGSGMEIVMLVVNETDGVYITRRDVAELMQPGEIEGIVPKGGVLKDYGIVSVESLPGYFIDFGLLMERAGLVLYQEVREYAFFYRDRMISLQCAVVGPESQHDVVMGKFERLKPLCMQVINSVVLPEKYLQSKPETRDNEGVFLPAI